VRPRIRHRSEAVDVDRGQLVGRRLNRFAVVVSLDKVGSVGGWASSGCERRRLERSAEVREDLPDGSVMNAISRMPQTESGWRPGHNSISGIASSRPPNGI